MTIKFDNGQEVPLTAAKTVLAQALAHDVPMAHACGGNARCSTCRVVVTEGDLPPPNEAEQALRQRLGLPPEVRLACQLAASHRMQVRRVIRDAVDREILDLSNDAREQSLTVLFSDIRSFTSFSSRHLPYDVVHILNRYFLAMGRCIDDHGGTVDKYMGDGVMAVFGLGAGEHPSRLALGAARAMLRELAAFNVYLHDAFGERFEMGVGIHHGPVVVGRVGHPKTARLTVIGDTVNVASRIESATKGLATVLLSEQAYAGTGEQGWQAHDVSVRGKSEPLRVYAMPLAAAPPVV